MSFSLEGIKILDWRILGTNEDRDNEGTVSREIDEALDYQLYIQMKILRENNFQLNQSNPQ